MLGSFLVLAHALLIVTWLLAARGTCAAKNNVACIGDNAEYPPLMQRLLDVHMNGTYSVADLGCPGATIRRTGAAPYWDCPQFANLVSSQWDVVLVMIGSSDARDIGSGGPEHWPRACDVALAVADLPSCAFASDYTELLSVIARLGPADRGGLPQIFVVSPPPVMLQVRTSLPAWNLS